MTATILRSEAKKIIDSGECFDLAFVTADRRRGTGGNYIEVKQWKKGAAASAPDVPPGKPALKPELIKNPNHRINKTFNICHPNNGMIHPHKVHYRLMQVLNGKTIIS